MDGATAVFIQVCFQQARVMGCFVEFVVGGVICGSLAAYILADSAMTGAKVLIGVFSFVTIVAMLVFTAGLLGLLAAWFENGRMLNTFALGLLVLCVLESTCVVLAFVYREQGCGLVLFHQINDHYLAAGIMSLLTCACQLGAVVCASLLSEMVASKVKS
ncbi:unnamed protein product [Mesocestoides corti]|uniref:MARVEL domain-containing protein n=1 Tax=Mesocestoides corti TaxID=53468 RepID=A0A0R3UAT6_MESCO|nr:unnamed protein product [Mesocestoides corti]